ncbi:WavE lipopolysaccharide synthesis family protein [Epibacterium sp. DP7N7-1]|nr:WavE lipopolysaccharide synthesis family protein [Epibacterium sp. DP7N7-1]
MNSKKLETLLETLKSTPKADQDLDMVAWAYVERKDWPLPHYDEDTFWARRNEGAHETRLTTNLSSALSWLEEKWPENRIDFRCDHDGPRGEVSISVLENNLLTRNQFLGAPLSEAARCVAAICIEASERAENYRQLIWSHNIEALSKKLKPWGEWEVEQHGFAFHAVDHENRLMGSGIGSAKKALEARHRTEHLSVLLKMRLRYEETYPGAAPEVDKDDAGPDM